MATYTVGFYDLNPSGVIPTTTSSTFTWTASDAQVGSATITDNESGIQELTLDDDSQGGETATADVSINGNTSTGSNVDAELVWTVRDTVTGEEFQIIQFDVEDGAAAGDYTLSELPLVTGREYEVLDYDSNPNAASGDIAFTYTDYVAPDRVVEGTDGDDVIDASYTDDPQGDAPDDGGGDGTGGLDDLIIGGAGEDTISGGAGDDTIYGDNETAETGSTETLNWTNQGGNGSNISGGFSQDTGDVTVDVSFTPGAISDAIQVSTSTQYVGSGEDFNDNSALYLTSDGTASGTTATTTLDFSANADSGMADTVENVEFRINDIDSGGWEDIVTVNAYDADGNPVPVTFTVSGNETTSGNTITAGSGGNDPDQAAGSVLVSIPGPVAQVEVIYANGDTGGQALWVTDVHFDTIPLDDYADTIDGGAGDDTIYGGGGADTIQFTDNFGDDVVDGGDLGTDYDTLDFSQVSTPITGTYSGDEAGTINAGTDSVTFSDIEHLILTDGADQIDASSDSAGTDIDAGDGADVVTGGSGDDTIYGQGGNDTITGGAGDDTIYGDGTPPSAGGDPETLNWSGQGGDATDLSGGFTQSTGDMDVTVSFSSDGNNNPLFEVETGDAIYADTGEDFDTNSSLYLYGEGDGDTSTTTIDFAAANGSVTGEVENVEFRISDIDAFATNHLDEVTITAYDADGNPVPVTITTTGNDTISGDTVTAGNSLDDPDSAQGSVLVSIPGPVASIEISYANNETPSGGYTGTQAINVSDIHFQTIPSEPSGDDILAGGLGDDTIIGGAGDDQITVAEGDVAEGGDGDDTFILTDLGEAGGSDTITITGGEGDETLGDTLNLGGLVNPADITYTNTDDASGGLSGNFTLTDGTVVNFSEIENVVICFAAGTRILTPRGERPIEDLEIGDMVITADNGLQPIRWIGKRTVSASGDLAPVKIRKGTFSNTRDLLVSPQHRMLLSGYRAELLFGESEVLAPAIHLLDDHAVTREVADEVTYIHLLFDQHELVFAEGTPSESFHPGHVGMNAILDPAREELFRIFPELRCNVGAYGPTSRLCLKKHETKALISY
ncbi:type I secretion target repeat-containing protein [Actibacterium atlanticum]|uniref:Type I secretion target repeat-containing protein n=1 Tax=Actibacterium atlanticum TaxID=1461693 RepID=A0A058ZND6_9RHOB|nr:Hint domain-containing protein [Actibacterium atlanticum]KCV83139.1 type I secretion target repeat-containing protein [Actibacterium atlanticum]